METLKNTRLVPASQENIEAVYEMLQEIGPGENGFVNTAYSIPFADFPGYLRETEDLALGKGLKAGWVPMTTYWLTDGDYLLGVSKLRHYLSAKLLELGGHIGYSIRPTERGKGYGNLILELTLKESRRMGIERVLITCNEDNLVSRRVIENHGGILEKTANLHCYYWIELR